MAICFEKALFGRSGQQSYWPSVISGKRSYGFAFQRDQRTDAWNDRRRLQSELGDRDCLVVDLISERIAAKARTESAEGVLQSLVNAKIRPALPWGVKAFAWVSLLLQTRNAGARANASTRGSADSMFAGNFVDILQLGKVFG